MTKSGCYLAEYLIPDNFFSSSCWAVNVPKYGFVKEFPGRDGTTSIDRYLAGNEEEGDEFSDEKGERSYYDQQERRIFEDNEGAFPAWQKCITYRSLWKEISLFPVI